MTSHAADPGPATHGGPDGLPGMDAATVRLPVVPPVPVPRPVPAGDADPPTGPIPVPVPARPAAPAPAPADVATTALWAAAGLSGLLALGLLVDVVGGLAHDEGQWLAVVLALPTTLLAAGFGWLTWLVVRGRDTAPWLAGTLAGCTVVAAMAETGTEPGVLVCLGALLLAGTLAAVPGVRGALSAPAGAPPAPLRAARTVALWLDAGAVSGLLIAWSWAATGYGVATSVLSGILSVAVGLIAAWARPELGRVVAAPSGPAAGRLRAVLAAALVPGLLAAVFCGLAQPLLLAVVALDVSLVAAVLVPTAVRARLGEPPLAAVRQLDSSLPGGPGTPAERLGRAGYAALPDRVRSASDGVRVAAGAGVALIVVVLALATSARSDGDAVSALTILTGVLAAAAVFTPTMPLIWRALCAGGAALSFYLGFDTVTTSVQTGEVWFAGLIPLLLVAYVAAGALENRRNGVTSSAPGWIGPEPRTAPPGPSITFVPPPTAGGRSRIQLTAVTGLDPETVLATVSRATSVRGNWFVVGSDRVSVAGRGPGLLGLTIGSGSRGHAVFAAQTESDGTVTRLRVGGLDSWTQRRSYYYRVIPAGPAHVVGYWMYTLYLQTVASELRALDPRISVRIGSPR